MPIVTLRVTGNLQSTVEEFNELAKKIFVDIESILEIDPMKGKRELRLEILPYSYTVESGVVNNSSVSASIQILSEGHGEKRTQDHLKADHLLSFGTLHRLRQLM